MGSLQLLITIQSTNILHFTYGRPSWFDGFTALCSISCHIRYWQLQLWMYCPLVLFLLTPVHVVRKAGHGWAGCWIICCFLHFYTSFSQKSITSNLWNMLLKKHIWTQMHYMNTKVTLINIEFDYSWSIVHCFIQCKHIFQVEYVSEFQLKP